MKPDGNELRGIAIVYRYAAREGHPPVQAVARLLGVGLRTATRRIAEARRAGLLGDVAIHNRKVAAVAKSLGVTYEALANAVVQHAGGDLRITTEGQ